MYCALYVQSPTHSNPRILLLPSLVFVKPVGYKLLLAYRRPQKTWTDLVKNDMVARGLYSTMAQWVERSPLRRETRVQFQAGSVV